MSNKSDLNSSLRLGMMIVQRRLTHCYLDYY